MLAGEGWSTAGAKTRTGEEVPACSILDRTNAPSLHRVSETRLDRSVVERAAPSACSECLVPGGLPFLDVRTSVLRASFPVWQIRGLLANADRTRDRYFGIEGVRGFEISTGSPDCAAVARPIELIFLAIRPSLGIACLENVHGLKLQ